MFREDSEFHDDAGPSHLGRPQAAAAAGRSPSSGAVGGLPRRTRVDRIWRRGRRKGTEEDSLLRARQGPRQHRKFRASSAAWRPSLSRRCTMRKPISAAEEASVKVVIVTMDYACRERDGSRARRRWRKKSPVLQLHVHAASEFAADPDQPASAASPTSPRPTSSSAVMLFLEEHFQPLLPALTARRDHCDAMVCAMSAGEVTKLTRMGKFDMSAPASGPMALLKKLRGAKDKSGVRRRQPDGDAAPPSEAAALHSRHGAGRARLFPDAAILARRLRREHGQPGAVAGRSLRGRSATSVCAARSRRRRRPNIPKSASIIRACPAASPRRSTSCRRTAGERQGDRRPAGHALLCARGQRRPLRRRDRGARSARAAGHPGLRHRSRRAPGDRDSSSSRTGGRPSTRWCR